VVERILGKDEVMGSIPIAGSISPTNFSLSLTFYRGALGYDDKLKFVGHQENYGKGKI
jgi:hypothetical protein